jgi:hypothetical protein
MPSDRALARDRALNNSVAPLSEATVAVEAAVRLLRLLDPGLQPNAASGTRHANRQSSIAAPD